MTRTQSMKQCVYWHMQSVSLSRSLSQSVIVVAHRVYLWVLDWCERFTPIKSKIITQLYMYLISGLWNSMNNTIRWWYAIGMTMPLNAHTHTLSDRNLYKTFSYTHCLCVFLFCHSGKKISFYENNNSNWSKIHWTKIIQMMGTSTTELFFSGVQFFSRSKLATVVCMILCICGCGSSVRAICVHWLNMAVNFKYSVSGSVHSFAMYNIYRRMHLYIEMLSMILTGAPSPPVSYRHSRFQMKTKEMHAFDFQFYFYSSHRGGNAKKLLSIDRPIDRYRMEFNVM